jgi:molecular chaperone GrpE
VSDEAPDTSRTTTDPQEAPETAPPAAPGGEAVAEGEQAAAQAEAPEPEPEAAEAVEEDLDALRARAGERDEYLALAQRTQADFENYRKRVARDAAAALDRGVRKLAQELLPALDHLDAALQAIDDPEVTEGMRLVQGEFVAALNRAGIEPFSPEGEPFDPNEHEAMAQQPAEGAESGHVVSVYQQGYRHNGAVLRPARVVVAA